jgi:hypothetical protein
MKKLLLFVGFGLISLSGISQERSYSKALTDHFQTSELDAQSDQEIAFLEYMAQNAFVISDFPKEKADNTNRYSSINLDLDSVDDFFDLNIEMKENDFQYFRISGSDKMLVIKSKSIVKREFEAKK